jgi:muramoyltetrapeptide carboxypeptidase
MKYIHPPALRSGMTIGVVAPSGPICADELETSLHYIKRRGYKVRLGKSLYARYGFLAGTDAARADDFNMMFADPEVHAVFCARGGYGACRILDYIDWNLPKKHPKIFCGYSDITTLHLALQRYCHLITFHTPMITRFTDNWDRVSEENFWRLLESPSPYGGYDATAPFIRKLHGGKTSGRLVGGCLSLLAAAVGTAESPDFTDAIVLVEDVNEANYRVDRMLMQLQRAGLLEKAAGFVIGDVTGDRDQNPSDDISLEDIWKLRIASLGKPVIAGFPFGHVQNPASLPLGCLAELDADTGSLTILESAVA